MCTIMSMCRMEQRVNLEWSYILQGPVCRTAPMHVDLVSLARGSWLASSAQLQSLAQLFTGACVKGNITMSPPIDEQYMPHKGKGVLLVIARWPLLVFL